MGHYCHQCGQATRCVCSCAPCLPQSWSSGDGPPAFVGNTGDWYVDKITGNIWQRSDINWIDTGVSFAIPADTSVINDQVQVLQAQVAQLTQDVQDLQAAGGTP